jgi:DNA-binding NarL/FixJ family response regulator
MESDMTSNDATAPGSSPARKSVLIVEDNHEFQWFLSDCLKKTGHDWEIHACLSVAESRAVLRKGLPRLDLALIDIGLPDGDGTDIISYLSRVASGVPILAVTVMRSERDLLEAIKAGAMGYVLKDDDALSVSAAINQVMAGIYPVSPSLARHLVRLAQKPTLHSDFVDLTDQQFAVLERIATGHTYQEIADALGLSISTIRTHVQKLYGKLKAKTGSEAVAKAKTIGLI